MPRGSSRSSGGRSSSKSSSAPAAKPTQTASGATRPSQRPQTAVQPHAQQPTGAAQRPAPQSAPNAAQPGAPHAPQPVQQVSSGPGLLGTIGSVAVGSVLGNMISDRLRGDGAPAAETAAAGNMAQQQPAFDNQNPCFQFRSNYDMCVNQNQNNIASCQFTWDAYRDCLNNNNAQNWS